MENNNPNKFYWLYLIGLFLIVFLPLLNLPPWFSPPDWGKTIVFRIVMSVLIFLFIYQILFKRHSTFGTIVPNALYRSFRKNLAFWLLIALFFVFLLSTLFSLDRNFSFWGSPYRSGGFVNFAFFIIFSILAFLVIRPKDWSKVWDFAIIIGILVSIIAILQEFRLFDKVFIYWGNRPPSTVGGPIFLGIYLLLLSFITLVFGIKEKIFKKRIFYFASLLLFIFVILITLSRAAYFGLAVGVLYFVLFYPSKIYKLKTVAIFLLILGIFSFFLLKNSPIIEKIPPLQSIIQRVTNISLLAEAGRISTWKIGLEAIKEKPILGWGPENFSTAFDKYYDPALFKITSSNNLVWWDRAHNFIFDIGVTAGIPALMIYLGLFGVLFWQLQRLKSVKFQHSSAYSSARFSDKTSAITPNNAEHYAEQRRIIAHGLQATFIAYLVAMFFSFDTFSTYLILFLLIGYSLHLISSNTAELTPISTQKNAEIPNSALNQRIVQLNFSGKTFFKRIYTVFIKWRILILTTLGILLIWFIWQYNIKPFRINAEINKNLTGEIRATEVRVENLSQTHTFLDSYLVLKYINIIQNDINQNPRVVFMLSQKSIPMLEKGAKARPTYTRNWLLLGSFTNNLIQSGRSDLAEKANYYFERALQFSPKRQEILIEWAKTDFLTDKYEQAEEKAQKCINLNTEYSDCFWFMGLTQISSGNITEGEKYLAMAVEKGYDKNSRGALLALSLAYGKAKYYPPLIEIFKKLIKIESGNPQFHASLAFVYREVGEIEKAREQAMKIWGYSPEITKTVEEFLKTLSR